jgi:ABC-type phosphate transport system permease subunit
MRLDVDALSRMLLRRQVAEIGFRAAAIAALLIALGSLAALLVDAFVDGAGRLSWQFLTSFPSRHPEQAGILAALVGSVALIVLTAAFALPVGVGAAVYLEEYAGKTWWSRVIEVNIANLAGVPSIVYGLLGLELFVRALKLERSLLAGALTMALLVSRRARHCAPCPTPSARPLVRWAPRGGRRSGIKCCPWHFRGSSPDRSWRSLGPSARLRPSLRSAR